jgi:hypothetical protein
MILADNANLGTYAINPVARMLWVTVFLFGTRIFTDKHGFLAVFYQSVLLRVPPKLQIRQCPVTRPEIAGGRYA